MQVPVLYREYEYGLIDNFFQWYSPNWASIKCKFQSYTENTNMAYSVNFTSSVPAEAYTLL